MSKNRGFTLIELLVVILILSLLMVVLLPNIVGGKESAYEFACRKNLQNFYAHIQSYEIRHRRKPRGGGPAFLYDLWKGVMEHTEDNRDMFFCPAQRDDPHYQEDILPQDPEQLWPSLDDFNSEDTHYAARGKRYKRNMDSGKAAWIADDNEGGSNHRSGTINVLYGNGTVRPITKLSLEEDGLWGGGGDGNTEEDEDYAFPVGPDSPLKALRKLSVTKE
ncbi:MAG: prepilin-type N-terminal cleavage/methylation domain-containing protein [Planctomycetota bacterium]